MVGMSGEQIYELFRNAPGGERMVVVPVPPAPARVIPWSMLLSGDTIVTYAQQKAEHDAASQHNVDVMIGYEVASVFNTTPVNGNGAPPRSTDIERDVLPPAHAPAEPGVVLPVPGSRGVGPWC